MDVGDPSNFVRLTEIFDHDISHIRRVISSYTVNDATTLETISDVYNTEDYLLEPHGAVAYQALNQYIAEHPGERGIILETAHPIKFVDVVEKTIGEKIEIPEASRHLIGLRKMSIDMTPEFEKFKEYLMSRR